VRCDLQYGMFPVRKSMLTEMTVLEEIRDKVVKIDKDVAVVKEHLKNQNGAISRQNARCEKTTKTYFDKLEKLNDEIDKNTGFRNQMKGYVKALGAISTIAAIVAIAAHLL